MTTFLNNLKIIMLDKNCQRDLSNYFTVTFFVIVLPLEFNLKI
jgi:hypothetical protein